MFTLATTQKLLLKQSAVKLIHLQSPLMLSMLAPQRHLLIHNEQAAEVDAWQLAAVDQTLQLDIDSEAEALQMKGRNSRRPKKANHGARPCSSYMRKLKQKGWYHIVKAKD